jgi:hypothetical protein
MAKMRACYVKLRLRQCFPMDFTEALNPAYGPPLDPGCNGSFVPCPLAPLPGYVAYLKKYGISSGNGFSFESSACLLMVLDSGIGGAAVDASLLTAGGFGGVDDQGYGVPILTDAWKRPVYFSRVPTGCPSLNPNGQPQPGLNDRGDPQGFLNDGKWQSTTICNGTCAAWFQNYTKQPLQEGLTWVVKPMVASGGPDKNAASFLNTTTFAPMNGGSPMYAQ